jgi:ABC-type glycerol-3-phosphate transport system substrate-binding protein
MLTIKKVLAILLACLMLLGVMGCMANQSTDATTTETQAAATEEPAATEEESSGEEAASAPSGTVEFWTLYSPGTIQSELYDEIVADFNASHPDITVNISYVGQDIVTQIRPTIINGNPPDLFVCNTGIGSTLAEEGVLMTLNDYLADSDYSGEQVWSDTFIDGSLEAGVMTGDDIQMIPFELGITCWFYNKGLFDELGLTEPTTWDEMAAIFEKISEAGVAPIGADGNVDFYLSWYYSNLAIRLAGHDKYVSAISGETSWTEPEFLEAAQKLQEMLPYFQKGFEGTQYPGANALFVQGQAAMMYVGSWLPQEILSIMPEGFELGMFEWSKSSATAFASRPTRQIRTPRSNSQSTTPPRKSPRRSARRSIPIRRQQDASSRRLLRISRRLFRPLTWSRRSITTSITRSTATTPEPCSSR